MSAVLVVGAPRNFVLAELERRGVPARGAGELGALEGVAVVVLASPRKADALAVLEAGRILVMRAAEPLFGLLPGVDHLAADNEHDLAQAADTAATYADHFAPIVAMGRLAAKACA